MTRRKLRRRSVLYACDCPCCAAIERRAQRMRDRLLVASAAAMIVAAIILPRLV